MSVQDKLRAFLIHELHCDVLPEQLTDDYALIDESVIDSMGIYEVVTFVEQEYGIEILDDDLIPENFESIAQMSRLVEARLSR